MRNPEKVEARITDTGQIVSEKELKRRYCVQ
jgi:hypothetical protein